MTDEVVLSINGREVYRQAASVVPPPPPPPSARGYSVRGGKLYDAAGAELQLRGINHHGFNSPILRPQFLWAQKWKEQIAQMKGWGFNAIRLPFVPATLHRATAMVDSNIGQNNDLIGKTPLQTLDMWMEEADRQGMYILPDFHSPSAVNMYFHWFVADPADYGAGRWVETWNQQPYTPDDWVNDLVFVAKRYAGLPRFLGLDLFNEPHDRVRWSAGDPGTAFWKPAAERAAAAVLAANPNLLIFAEGITANWDGKEKTGIAINWGENFQPQAYEPLDIPADKLVLSPHTYGPDVYAKSSFRAPNYPANLAADWETLFGQFAPKHPVVIGEWGGRYGKGTSSATGPSGPADVAWQNALVDYLIGKGQRSSFYFCYINSGDTGGILENDLTVREDKLALLRRLWGG